MENSDKHNSRRLFISKLAAGTALGVTSLGSAVSSWAGPAVTAGDADEWFKKAKGSHRIVYDASEPHDAMPLIWTWVYYQTNNQTGTSDKDMTAMVVLRHNAIPFAMEDSLWKKYNFGKVFNVTDNTTKLPAERNPYYLPKDGDYPMPGIDGIKALQDRGAMFCVCGMALGVYSAMVAGSLKLNPEEVKKEWMNGVLKDIQVVPSGVWAIGKAQQNGFGYCYAGG